MGSCAGCKRNGSRKKATERLFIYDKKNKVYYLRAEEEVDIEKEKSSEAHMLHCLKINYSALLGNKLLITPKLKVSNTTQYHTIQYNTITIT
jgi:hypothetical protein